MSMHLINIQQFIFRYFNISAKVANSLSVICTLCPIYWVETRNDKFDKLLNIN